MYAVFHCLDCMCVLLLFEIRFQQQLNTIKPLFAGWLLDIGPGYMLTSIDVMFLSWQHALSSANTRHKSDVSCCRYSSVVRLEAFLLFLPCLKRVLRKRGTFRHSPQLYQKQLTCTQRFLLLCPFSEQLTVKVARLWTFDDIDIWSTGAWHKKIRLGFKRENILNEQ